MSEQMQPNPTPRRRRKLKRPKWVTNKFTYQLWRNWPLIRFVLLCILVAAILFGLGRCAVSAIGGLFEKDCGGASGWMYCVNGTFPNMSSDKYKLINNDSIELHYTVKSGDIT